MRPDFTLFKAITPRLLARTLGWIIPCLCLLGAKVQAQPTALREYDVKAAFLYNVAKYTDWPPEAFSVPSGPIIIGVLGEDPFGEVLDRITHERVINGHPIVVLRARGIAELRNAHLVFISPSESPHVAQDCAAIEKFHVLTIGDTAQSAPFTAVNFGFENDKIVFSVDLNRAAQAGVNLSSKLLRLAKSVVRPDKAMTK